MTIVAKVDFNSPLPTQMVNFIIRHLAGVLLISMQDQAKKNASDSTCKHAERIRQNKAFYTDWLKLIYYQSIYLL